MNRLPLRRRLMLVAAAAVAAVAVGGSLAGYLVVRGTLRGQVDESLRQAVERVGALPVPGPLLQQAPLQGPAFDVRILLDEAPGIRLRDVELDGVHARVITFPAPDGTTIQLARSLEEVDATLADLRLGLLVIVLAGIGGAALLARLAARTALKPVADLTAAAEHVTATDDLSRRIEAPGDDEVARLAAAFNSMLGALERSRAAQRALVADASHELRTPLTALRTNLEVLADGARLDERDREKLRADLVAQLEDLTLLVGDLVELARDEPAPAGHEPADVRLDLLVAAAAERAQRHAPGVRFAVDLAPSVVHGDAARIDRAVANLLDNAAKFSRAGDSVEVTVHDGELAVRDHGPGIAHHDLPHVFERFYRAPAARGLPGSGLGLAIVRQVAEAHGGSVHAEAAPGGGALMRLRLPSSSSS